MINVSYGSELNPPCDIACLINSSKIRNFGPNCLAIHKNVDVDSENIFGVIKDTSYRNNSISRAAFRLGYFSLKIYGESLKDKMIRDAQFNLEMSNPSHSLAEFALVDLKIPMLKKDLVFRGTLSLLDVVRIANDQKLIIPLSEILAVYRSKGLPSEINIWKKFLLSIGVQ